jgi:hypothetical protein
VGEDEAAGNLPATGSTRLLMTLSAVFLGALGVAASFLPQEILHRVGSSPDRVTTAIVQIAGALYVGFAILNWMAKGMLLGGIYGRPIVLANLTHFVMGAIGLLEVRGQSGALLVATSAYSMFAVWFGYVLFGPGPPSASR